MLKIGLVAETWIHEYVYPAFFNGVNDRYAQLASNWAKQMVQTPSPDREMKITGLWGANNGITEVWSLPVYNSLDTLADSVDAAIILEKNGARHLDMAKPFLQRGLPVFIDKPLANTVDDAAAIVGLAEANQTAIISGSALGQTIEVEKAIQDGFGEGPRAITAFGIGEYWEYGSHPIELGLSLLQEEIRQVKRRKVGSTWLWQAEGTESTLTVQLVRGGQFAGYKAHVSGEQGMIEVNVSRMPESFARLVNLVRATFTTRRFQVEPGRLIAPVKFLAASED